MHQIHNITLRKLHPSPCFVLFFCGGCIPALVLPRCSGLRQPLHLSLHSCASSLFSLPAALTALLRVVDPLQDLQPVWSAVYTPGRPSRLFGVGGWEGAAPPLADLHAHKPPPNSPEATTVSSSLLLNTAHTNARTRFPALPLCSYCHPFSAHKSRACWEN